MLETFEGQLSPESPIPETPLAEPPGGPTNIAEALDGDILDLSSLNL